MENNVKKFLAFMLCISLGSSMQAGKIPPLPTPKSKKQPTPQQAQPTPTPTPTKTPTMAPQALIFQDNFLRAISSSDKALVEQLIDTGHANLELREHGKNALELALETNNETIIQLILEFQEKLRAQELLLEESEENLDNQHVAPGEATLYQQLEEADAQEAQEIIFTNVQEALEALNERGDTVLHLFLRSAVANPEFKELAHLIMTLDEERSILDTQNNFGERPVHIAFAYAKDLGEFVDRFVSYGVELPDENAPNFNVYQQGQLLSQAEAEAQEEYLLAREANVAEVLGFINNERAMERVHDLLRWDNNHINDIDSEGNTVLMNAAAQGLSEIVNMLLKRNVNPCYCNPRTGENALLHLLMNPALNDHSTLSRDQEEILHKFLDYPQAPLLLQATCSFGNALHLAIQAGCPTTILETMYKLNPKLIKEADANGQTTLHKVLIYTKNNNTACWLIDNSVDIDAIDRDNQTALELAVEYNLSAVVEKLLAKDVAISDALYTRLLQKATREKNVNLLESLILHRSPATSAEARQTAYNSVKLSDEKNDRRIKHLLTLPDELFDADFLWKIAHKDTSSHQILKAVREKDTALLQSMRQNVNEITTSWGLTPFILSLVLGHEDCTRALIKIGADVETPFHGKSAQDILMTLISSEKLGPEAMGLLDSIDRKEILRERTKKSEQEQLRAVRLARFTQNPN